MRVQSESLHVHKGKDGNDVDRPDERENGFYYEMDGFTSCFWMKKRKRKTPLLILRCSCGNLKTAPHNSLLPCLVCEMKDYREKMHLVEVLRLWRPHFSCAR